MITIGFHCRNKSFTPTSFLYKVFSSNPLEASPCIYRDSFGNYRTKKKNTEKMLKISVPHTDLQFCPCYCLEGITGCFCNPENLGREGKQLVLLLRAGNGECAKRSNRAGAVWHSYCHEPGSEQYRGKADHLQNTFILSPRQAFPQILKTLAVDESTSIGYG